MQLIGMIILSAARTRSAVLPSLVIVREPVTARAERPDFRALRLLKGTSCVPRSRGPADIPAPVPVSTPARGPSSCHPASRSPGLVRAPTAHLLLVQSRAETPGRTRCIGRCACCVLLTTHSAGSTLLVFPASLAIFPNCFCF